VVALGAVAGALEFVARREIALVPAAQPAQPYHAAAGHTDARTGACY
jgi:hypothetical protein